MATKKQKRAVGLAKHEAFMEERRLSGLQAQRIDRERREKRLQLKEQAAARARAKADEQPPLDYASIEQECI